MNFSTLFFDAVLLLAFVVIPVVLGLIEHTGRAREVSASLSHPSSAGASRGSSVAQPGPDRGS